MRPESLLGHAPAPSGASPFAGLQVARPLFVGGGGPGALSPQPMAGAGTATSAMNNMIQMAESQYRMRLQEEQQALQTQKEMRLMEAEARQTRALETARLGPAYTGGLDPAYAQPIQSFIEQETRVTPGVLGTPARRVGGFLGFGGRTEPAIPMQAPRVEPPPAAEIQKRRQQALEAQKAQSLQMLGGREQVIEEETPEAGIPRQMGTVYPSPVHAGLARDIQAGLPIQPSQVVPQITARAQGIQAIAAADKETSDAATARTAAAWAPSLKQAEYDVKQLDIALKDAELARTPLVAAKAKADLESAQADLADKQRKAAEHADQQAAFALHQKLLDEGRTEEADRLGRQMATRGWLGPSGMTVLGLSPDAKNFQVTVAKTKSDLVADLVKVTGQPDSPGARAATQQAAAAYNQISHTGARALPQSPQKPVMMDMMVTGLTGGGGIRNADVVSSSIVQVPTYIYEQFDRGRLGSGQPFQINGIQDPAYTVPAERAVAYDIVLREWVRLKGDFGAMANMLNDPKYYPHLDQTPGLREKVQKEGLPAVAAKFGGTVPTAPGAGTQLAVPQQPYFPQGVAQATPVQVGQAVVGEAGRLAERPVQAVREGLESVAQQAQRPIVETVTEAIRTPFQVGQKVIQAPFKAAEKMGEGGAAAEQAVRGLVVPNIAKRDQWIREAPGRYTPEAIRAEATRQNVDPDFLLALRRTEAGREGLEFGVFGPGGDPKRAPKDQLEQAARLTNVYMRDYSQQTGEPPIGNDGRLTPEFLNYFSRRYAPLGAGNDPKNLNKNHLANLTKFYYGMPAAQRPTG